MARVVVPVAVLEGEAVSLGLMELLGTVDVTVLGYHVLPEQTTPDQARLQYEDRANEALADIAEEFRRAGGDATYRLVFTHDRAKTLRRIAREEAARAYAITGATGAVDRLLVPLSGAVDRAGLLDFVADLVDGRPIGVTLLLVAADEAAGRPEVATAADRLADRGIDVATELATGVRPIEALVAAVPNHDAVVMGEQAPSLQSFLLGDAAERIAAESVGPVLVVRQDRSDTASD